MTGIALPRLELSDHVSPFDEAVLIIDGHEEETITIECPGSRELAEKLVQLVNDDRRLEKPYRRATRTRHPIALSSADRGTR
jgi:hypothetical protein